MRHSNGAIIPFRKGDKLVLNGPNGRPFIRFGVFEYDPESGELRKSGILVHLPPQPARVLALLTRRPGQIVTREEIREQVWGGETYIDFEHGLNHCINQIRTALCDDADAARFIQTLPRRGYRFIASVEPASPAAVQSYVEEPSAVTTPSTTGKRRSRTWRFSGVAVAGLAALAVAYRYDAAGLRSRLFPGTMDLPKISSIAVLPLVNLSGDPAQEYFADGMTEELITALGKIRALKVISRTSVMRYKRTEKPTPQIARELGVDALIEGTVTRSDGRVRLTVNLLHGPTDRHLWAESYEHDFDDVLHLQRELAQAVAKQVRVASSADEFARSINARPINPEAHELYLKGQYHYYKWRKEEFDKAVTYFEKAISIDPDYAQAHLGLAKTYGWLWMVGAMTPAVAYPKFNAALKRALAIDDDLPEAHYVLAVSAWYFFWNWAQAEAEFKRALELNPNLEEARFEYAWFLSTMGRHEEAIAEARRAVEGDPFSVSANLALGSIYNLARQHDKAIEQLLKTIELEPTDPRGYDFLAGAYKSLGLLDECVRVHQQGMIRMGGKPEVIEEMMQTYRNGGEAAYLRWRLKLAKHPFEAAKLQAQLGLKDAAFKNLEEAYRQRWWAMVRLNTNPEWDPLRSDPRFRALLARMKFP